MKKQLLLGTALLAAVTAFPQNGRVKPQPSGAERIQKMFLPVTENAGTGMQRQIGPSPDISASTMSTSANWQKIGGSINILSVLVSSSKPLQYNDELNAVSFIHRKSASYPAQPVSNSGAIVAEITTDWGATWDSTCVWSNGTQLARYPQGGIYNPPGNTNISNAYVVVTGPATGGSGWLGSYYASKQLGTGNYNYTASSAPGAQQFFPNSSATGTVPGHDHARYGFTATDDGKVRTLAEETSDPGGSGVLPGDSAVLLMTGSFNAGAFTWSSQEFKPSVVMGSDGSYNMYASAYMAWNNSGTVGYVMILGALKTATLSNRGFQPIVYKTTNSGASWAMITGLDFNTAPMNALRAPLAATQSNTNMEIPYFNSSEGIDLTVDVNDKLHIVSTLIGTYDLGADSLSYIYSFTNADGEKYRWPHEAGFRPYIYDFIGDGTSPWTYLVVDSMSSEVPSSSSTGNGYNDNPWDADPSTNNKVSSGARIQMSRTPDGKYIVYTFAESDTNFTNNAHKWNALPNIKARAASVTLGGATTLSPTELNVTKPAAGNGTVNPAVNGRAMFHYVSPLASAPLCGPSTTITVPMTITNSNPYSQLTNNTHWYSSAKLDFAGLCVVGINENKAADLAEVTLFPNPASNNFMISLDVKESSPVNVNVYNAVGQLVKTAKVNSAFGKTDINVNTESLTPGVYMVNVKAGGLTSTKKLIIE
jgi:hypothetical protein